MAMFRKVEEESKGFKTLFFFWPGLQPVELNGDSRWQQQCCSDTAVSCVITIGMRGGTSSQEHCILGLFV